MNYSTCGGTELAAKVTDAGNVVNLYKRETPVTKKHFEAIADALHYVKPSNPLTGPQNHKVVLEAMSKEWVYAVDAVAKVCQQFNGRFDREVFEHRAHFGHNATQKCCSGGK